jgi:LAO/AO transport system kinase
VRRRDTAVLVPAAVAGDRTALARLLSLVEQGGETGRDVSRLVHPHGGRAYAVGITGAPGAGKSTLTDRLITAVRDSGDEVAVLAVDPSSPFTGGAILGDRVRMGEHFTDDGVFIRSMASRGHLGGLALAAPEAVRVLDAAGFPWVLLETVGVGQVEVEIAGAADTTVVVVNPGWGDSVQANKAGLMEIADLFVINKADRPGVNETQRDLESMLDLSGVALHDARQRVQSGAVSAAGVEPWRPLVVRTSAAHGDGVDELWSAILTHQRYLQSTGELQRRRERRIAGELRALVAGRLERLVQERVSPDDLAALQAAVVARETSVHDAADRIVRQVT